MPQCNVSTNVCITGIAFGLQAPVFLERNIRLSPYK